MITKPTKVSFLRCVDKFVLGKGHEIEVLDALIIVLDSASAELNLINHFTNVFINEVMGVDVGISSQTVAFLFSLEYCNLGICPPLEALVLASGPAAAVTHALNLGGAIDTVRVFAAGCIGLRRNICSGDQNLQNI